MPRPDLERIPCTFEELRKRGDRAITQGIEAVRVLREVTGEAHDLRARVDLIHHHGARSFGAYLLFLRAD